MNATPHRGRIPALGPTLATWSNIEKRYNAGKIRRKAHHIGGVRRFDIELVHGGGNCLCAVEEVVIYVFTIRCLDIVAGSALVYEAHLLDDRRLARSTRA